MVSLGRIGEAAVLMTLGLVTPERERFLMLPNLTPQQLDRFYSCIDRSGGPTACHPWRGTRDSKGYGQFAIRVNGQRQRFIAHRLNYQLAAGLSLTPKQLACHHCDDPLCCNEAHVFIGSHADNMADMRAKGRAHSKPRPMFGEDNPRSKLTWPIVRLIRSDPRSSRVLARDLRVSDGLIRSVRLGRLWKEAVGA